MSKNVNAIVYVDPRNLNVPTETFKARQLCAFRAEIRNAPDDMQAVGITIFKQDGTHFVMLPCSQDDNGVWTAKLGPLMFPTVGEAKYEVVGKDEDGNNVALASGRLTIAAFATGGTPIPSGTVIPVTEIADTNGVAHRIIAVNVGDAQHPDWTTQVEVQ